MARKTVWTMLATVALGIGLLVAPATAKNLCSPLKNHTKGCKNEIKGNVKVCEAIADPPCSTLKGKDKHTCIKTCKTTWGGKTGSVATACASDSTVCTASPSGAFVR